MAFSFEPFLAISAGHIMAVSAGPEQEQYISVLFEPGVPDLVVKNSRLKQCIGFLRQSC